MYGSYLCVVDCEVEEDNFDVISSPPKSPSPPPFIPQPQFHNQPSPPSLISRPKLRPPLPPPKSALNSSHGYDDSALYEDPNSVEFPFSDGQTDDLYDCSISDTVLQRLNTQPPPVWRNPANDSVPPPLPPTRHSRRFTRSLERPFSPQNLPPPLPDRSSRDEPPLSIKKLPKIPKLRSPLLPAVKTPQPVGDNRATTPPAMPLAHNFRADLGAQLKLRQNITKSWSEDDQSHYDDIDDKKRTIREFSPRGLMSDESTGSDTGSYVDCDPNEPQSYIEATDPRPMSRDWSSAIPPPLPSRSAIAPPISDDDDDDAPPIPRRHPQASGRTLPKPSHSSHFSPHNINNPLPLPPRSKSPILDDTDAPPVPSRGPESTRPPLNRPRSDKGMNSLLPPTPHRGLSAPPVGGARLPMPPPKNARTETDNGDIFENVDFNNKRMKNYRDNSPVSTQPTDTNRPSDKQPARSPRPVPKNTISSKPAPLPKVKPPTSTKPTKPRVTSPPPVSSKPKVPKNDVPFSNSGTNQLQQNIDESGPAVSPRIRKKIPDPSLSNGIESRNKLTPPDITGAKRSPATAPKLPKKIPEPSETRRKLPDPSFLSKLSETTSNPPFKLKKTLPDPPVPYSPETRRKSPSGFEATRQQPEYRNGPPETAKKPPPPTPKEKPVLNKFQNNDLAACLQSNNNPSFRRPPAGGASQRPVAPPPKPKPMLPPGYR